MDVKGYFFWNGWEEKDPNCKFPRSYPSCIQENAGQSPRNKLFDGVGFSFMGNTGRLLNYNFNWTRCCW